MANPAEILHGVLTEWANSGNTQVYVHRDLEGAEANMVEHRRAMRLIEEISQIVAGMPMNERRKESIDRNLAKWTKWVFAYPHDWHLAPKAGYPNLYDSDALDQLDLLAHLLDSHVPKITTEQRAKYGELITELLATLADDETLPRDLREHVHSVATHARACLEDYALSGDFALQAAMERLTATVQGAMASSTKPGHWDAFRDKFAYPLGVGLMVSAASLGGRMITGG